MSKNNDIFNKYKSKIFNTEYTKDIKVDKSSQTQSVLSDYMDFIYNGSEVTRLYHYDIMKQAQLLLSVFTTLFSLVTIFICVMIGIIIISNKYETITLIPLLTGIATDLFAGTLILVMKSLLKSRDGFFKENIESEHFSKIIGLIQMLKEDSDKIPFIEKIVDNYCKSHSNTYYRNNINRNS